MVTKVIDQSQSVAAKAEIYYPDSDGQPMGESDFHISVMLYLRQALRYFFKNVDDLYVAANMLFYFEEGDVTACRAPDVFVVKGVSKQDRRVYKLWEERAAPCAIFEITSRSTRLEDFGTKRALYEMLGVTEYFLFDPMGEYLSPRLQGFRLVDDYYWPIEMSVDETLFSQELGLLLLPDGPLLRVVDPATGQRVPTLDEAVEQVHEAVEQAQEAIEQAHEAIEQAHAAVEQAKIEAQRANVEAQRAESESQRAESESQRAESEAQRAESEVQRAESEAQRAKKAEQRVVELEAELKRLQGRFNEN